jgi:hypothetical protein
MNRYHTTVAILACAVLPLAMLSIPKERDSIADQIADMAVESGLSRVAHEMYRDWLHQGRHQFVGFDLDARASYHLLGACDDDCSDLHFVLLTPEGQASWQASGTGGRPALHVEPPVSGRYQLRATMRQCKLQPCEWGVRVYRR